MKTAAIMAMFVAAALSTPALAQTQAQLNQMHQQQLRQLKQQQQAQRNAFRQQQRNYNSRVYNNNNWGRSDAQYRQALVQQIGNTMDAGQKAILLQRLRAIDGRWW